MDEDFEDFEEITTETLSEATMFLERLNQSTQSIDSFNNSGLDGLLDITAQIQDQARYEIADNLLNSTVVEENEVTNDQVLPDFDERPIRKRYQTDFFSAKW